MGGRRGNFANNIHAGMQSFRHLFLARNLTMSVTGHMFFSSLYDHLMTIAELMIEGARQPRESQKTVARIFAKMVVS